jgi:hypothetical protein
MSNAPRRREAAAVTRWAVVALLAFAPRAAGAEVPLRHEIALGLAGVYDVGYDRGLRYGVGYELSVSMLRVGAMLAAGDTDPSREQHWSLGVGLQPLEILRLDVAFHHRTFTTSGFGDNMVTFMSGLRWRGLVLDAGLALRFPITRRSLIHSPVEYDLALFDYFVLFRLGYLWGLGRGVELGVEAANIDRFEVRDFSYPTFAIVVVWSHPRMGTLRGEVGMGTAGFWSQGATIDRGFVRLGYTRGIP